MTNETEFLAFHPLIEATYMDVHKWLESFSVDYKKKSIRGKINDLLSKATLRSASAQYYVLFPAHFYKVKHALTRVIGKAKLLDWLSYTSKVSVIDIGCGAGAASSAFIDVLLELEQEGLITKPINVYFIGIDPNKNAVALYQKFLENIQDRLVNSKIIIEYNLIPHGNLQAVNRVKDFLNKKREEWGQPFLSHVFIMQVNVVSPFSQRYGSINTDYGELMKLGVDLKLLGEYHEAFGREEASAYKQILEDVAIDFLHIVTVGTQDWEHRVGEMAIAIDREFTDRHKIERVGLSEYEANYILPMGCYWTDWTTEKTHTCTYYLDVSSISNAELEDEDWNTVKSTNNLKLAWARSRFHLMEESIVDEIEIRLFESNLDENLERLQKQLMAYAEDIVPLNDRLSYSFPKNTETVRPRSLSRVEEEILSTAIIQNLGAKISGLAGRSYAYRFSRTFGESSTEHLYENWFKAYSRFIEDARMQAMKHDSCVVIRADIKSFFTRIIQDRLVEIASDRLSRSLRVEWLLRLLLTEKIDEHEAGLGIVQGNISSGFYANLYLLTLDSRFGSTNEWNVEFYRYVDDMIIIVPNPDHAEEILNTLEAELVQLGLELNKDKTEILTASNFLEVTAQDEILDQLQEEFDSIMNALWMMDEEHRKLFRQSYSGANDEWWYRVNLYQQCLQSLGVFVNQSLLSRRIYSYLFNLKKCKDELKRDKELIFPSLPNSNTPDEIERWVSSFLSNNSEWTVDKQKLQTKLDELLSEDWEQIKTTCLETWQEKRASRRLRYTINRLSQIGFGNSKDLVLELLRTSPWLIREPSSIVEDLSRQGFMEEIKELLSIYSNKENLTEEYMKAVLLRAVRFLPTLDLDLWNVIQESATSSSKAISLLATETWLHIADRVSFPPNVQIIESIRDILSNYAVAPRLQKNYILIIGKYKAQELNSWDFQDHLVREVYNSARTGDISNLLTFNEPETIRQNFYGGFRLDEDEYDFVFS